MSKKIFLVCSLYFTILGIIVLVLLKIAADHYDFHIEFQQGISIEFTQREIVLPTEEDLSALKDTYSNISTCFGSTDELKVEITELYNEVTSAKVSSIANRYFNELEEKHNEYTSKLSEVQQSLSLFEEQYMNYKDLLSNIPLYSMLLRMQKYMEFSKEIEPLYKNVLAEQNKVISDEEELLAYYSTSKQIADTLFDEEYEPMCHIVYAEARGCDAKEWCLVANVIENRIASPDPRYPDTIIGVIFSPGQYAPVTDGSYYLTPSLAVRKTVEDYLRGKIDTGMPSNVVYQAKFPQGSETWYLSPHGHYFCYR